MNLYGFFLKQKNKVYQTLSFERYLNTNFIIFFVVRSLCVELTKLYLIIILFTLELNQCIQFDHENSFKSEI